MKYLEIGIETRREGIELILSALMNLGITDAVVEDPADIDDLLKKEKGYEWDYIDDSVLELKNETPKVTIYMNDDEEGREKAEAVCAAMRELKTQAEAGAFGEQLDIGACKPRFAVRTTASGRTTGRHISNPRRSADLSSSNRHGSLTNRKQAKKSLKSTRAWLSAPAHMKQPLCASG